MLYKLLIPVRSTPMEEHARKHPRHKLHRIILFAPVIFFVILAVFTTLNHIYCGIISLFLGAVATLYCRPDLKTKIWIGGLLFLAIYTVYFGTLLLVYPDYVDNYWNLSGITGIKFLGIPIEELLFAITFGMYWSGLYEHLLWYQLKPNTNISND